MKPKEKGLKELCEECNGIVSFVEFEQLVLDCLPNPEKSTTEIVTSKKKIEEAKKNEKLCIDFKDVPSNISPESPQQFLLARTLALCIEPEKEGFDDMKKAQWQRYWLRCCLSDRCDYYFSVLKECGIDRETDVRYIVDESLKEGGLLEKHIGSDDGVKFYKKTIADWYLRRYNGKEAKRMLSDGSFGCWDQIKLCYPRLLVAIIVGMLAVVTGEDVWNLPHKISFFCVIFVSSGFVTASLLYLTYECYNVISDFRRAWIRALKVTGIGFLFSLFFSSVVCALVGYNSITYTNFTLETYYNFSEYPFLRNILFFASAALFIGIFIQVFWEEKTITEPL